MNDRRLIEFIFLTHNTFVDYTNDHEVSEIGMKPYDARYRWASYVQKEKHTWPPK